MRNTGKAFLLTAVTALALLTSGCEKRECIRSHLQPILVGKVTSFMRVCDEYAPEVK